MDTGSALLPWAPHWVPSFVVFVFLYHALGPSPALLPVMYVHIYLLPPTHRQGDTRRHSLVIDTLTMAEKGLHKGLNEKEALWKKRTP